MAEALPQGYRYHNPDFEEPIQIRYVDPNDTYLRNLAIDFQDVMFGAWTRQFGPGLPREAIAQTVNPHDTIKVSAQESRLREANQPGKPTYVTWNIERGRPCVAGVAKAVQSSRYFRRRADISNVFVRPGWQESGGGSAMLRTVLGRFPTNMETAVYDFPDINPQLIKTLGRYGFTLRKEPWDKEYFGQTIAQGWFTGPPVGELAEELTKRRPWLRNREPIPDNPLDI